MKRGGLSYVSGFTGKLKTLRDFIGEAGVCYIQGVKEYDEDAYSGDDQTTKGYKTARGFKPETSTEIDRLATINPAWVNVSVSHRAENANSDLRLIISTRFWPEVHDYFSN